MRSSLLFELKGAVIFKHNLLRWASNFKNCCYFDSCEATQQELNPVYSNYDCIVAVDKLAELQVNDNNDKSLEKLKNFQTKNNDWLFGFLSYDIKNEIEDLHSNNNDCLDFPALHFFRPKLVFFIKEGTLTIEYYCEHYS